MTHPQRRHRRPVTHRAAAIRAPRRLAPALEGEVLERRLLPTIPTTPLTLVVNSNADYDGTFDPNTGQPETVVSPDMMDLRAALDCANQQASYEASQHLPITPVTITFDIEPLASFVDYTGLQFAYSNPFNGYNVIAEGSNSYIEGFAENNTFPTVTAPVIIEGETQGESVHGSPEIDISGAMLEGGVAGLMLSSGDSTVTGLTFSDFNQAAVSYDLPAIELTGTGGDDIADDTFQGNNTCVSDQVGGNTIGGTVSGDRNLFQYSGVTVTVEGPLDTPLTTGDLIEGNYFGTDGSGETDTFNNGAGSYGNLVGIYLEDSSNNTIGGSTTDAGNLIAASTSEGIYIDGLSSDNLIAGNLIGTDATGEFALGNGEGILLDALASNNTIGGTTDAAANVISGNDIGIEIKDPTTQGNLVEGNLIGTDTTGTKDVDVNGNPLGNFTGIMLNAANGNTIGGTTSGAANEISGNIGSGIDINNQEQNTDSNGDPLGATANLIEGNFIGTDIKRNPLANEGDGIDIEAGDNTNNTIGGVVTGAGNVIADNGGNGVTIFPTGLIAAVVAPGDSTPADENSTGDSILGNSIYGNDLLGIDLGDDGVSANHAQPTPGPNNYQNYPILKPPNANGSIQGTLQSPAGIYRVEFFANPGASSTGINQGQTYLGFENVTIGSSGSASFSFTPQSPQPAGTVFTATATDSSGDTSEFTNTAALVVNETGDEELSQLQPGMLSLRAAIETVDDNPTSSPQVIRFDIPGSGVPVIDITGGQLPAITTPVVIDGTSQPGTAMVAINGSALGGNAPGLDLQAGDSTVRGLVIQGFGGNGITIEDAGGDTVVGNFIGTDPTGSTAVANAGDGVFIDNAGGNTIGGAGVQVIGGNANGIHITGNGASGNVVEGNQIGIDVAGTTAVPNAASGVLIDGGASGNTIGGTTQVARNVISGNTGAGVEIQASGNVIEGNYVGTDLSAQTAVPNKTGIELSSGASANTIGGTTAAASNLVSGNGAVGINIDKSTANLVLGNFVGTTPDGSQALGSQAHGVVLTDGAQNNTIGGTSAGGALAGAGNLISGNTLVGLVITGQGTSANSVEGNFIGTDPSGSTAVGNAAGVLITSGAQNNTIGGVAAPAGGVLAGPGNLVSGNTADGIDIAGSGVSGNVVEGDFLGTDPTGTTAVSNGANGLSISEGATNDTIGGTVAGAGNLISGNGADGVEITGSGTSGDWVEGNLIGTTPAGSGALGNSQGSGDHTTQAGVDIEGGATQNTIGGASVVVASALSGAGNVISGGQGYGVRIAGANQNVVAGNYIGLDLHGASPVPNQLGGVQVEAGAQGNTIGGTTTGTGDVISGNAADGVRIAGQNTNNNVVQGNLIGTAGSGTTATAADGKTPLGNVNGVEIASGAQNNTIGGVASGVLFWNLISGNSGSGVLINGADGNTLAGNFIGTDNTGNNPLPNGTGVTINNALLNDIGTQQSQTGNLISGNTGDGIDITGLVASSNLVANDWIGTTGKGTGSLPNNGYGVVIEAGAPSNTVGFPDIGSAAANVISGNKAGGVSINGAGSGNTLNGNAIGVGADGSTDANQGPGVLITNAAGNFIGGAAASAGAPNPGNQIQNNIGAGVAVVGNGSTDNAIESNSIYNNQGLGIDLGNTGTPNLGTEGPPGPNNNIAPPTLQLETSVTGDFVQLTYNGPAGENFTFQVFSEPLPDASGFGQGDVLASSTTAQVTELGGTGSGTYTAELRFSGYLSATVTDANGNTSEFSTTVSLPAGTNNSAPQLDVQSTTGTSNTYTRDTGTPSAPLVLNVPNSDPSLYYRLFDVTNPGSPVLVAGPVQEVGGVITVAGPGLSPGTHAFAYTTASTPTGTQSSLSPSVSITIQPSLALTSTSPANGAVVSALPGGAVTVTFSHPLAGLTSGGPALSGTDPYGIFLLARGPSGAFSAPGTTSVANGTYSGNLPLHTTATYQVNANGTSSIVLQPTVPLSSDVYLISITGSDFPDLAGNTVGGSGNLYGSFLLQLPPVNNQALQVTGVTTYNGSTTVGGNDPTIAQPDTFGIAFNRPLYPASVNANTFQLIANPGPKQTVVSAVAAYSPTNDTVYLTPIVDLEPGTQYEIVVAGKGSATAASTNYVSDDQGYGNPGFPLAATRVIPFKVSNAPAPPGSGPLKVTTNAQGAPNTLPASNVIWRSPMGYASIGFSEALNMTTLGRYSVMLVPENLPPNVAPLPPNIPLNTSLAFNPNTNQLIIVPTEPTGNNLIYVYSLQGFQGHDGAPLLNNAGQPAGVSGNAPYFETFELATGATPAVQAGDAVGRSGAVVTSSAPSSGSRPAAVRAEVGRARPAQGADDGVPRYSPHRPRGPLWKRR